MIVNRFIIAALAFLPAGEALASVRLGITSEGGVATRQDPSSAFIPENVGRSSVTSSTCYADSLCYHLGLSASQLTGRAVRPLTVDESVTLEQRVDFTLLTADAVFGFDILPMTLFKESKRGYPWLNPMLRGKILLGRFFYSPASEYELPYLQSDAGNYLGYEVDFGFDVEATKRLSLQFWLGFNYSNYDIGAEKLALQATTYGLGFSWKNARFYP